MRKLISNLPSDFTVGYILPYMCGLASIGVCAVFFHFYLVETSEQFIADFQNQNHAALINGDSFEIARALNALSGSVHWNCISASRSGYIFFERDIGPACNDSYWRHRVSTSSIEKFPINVSVTMTLAPQVKAAEAVFVCLQAITLWSLLLLSRRSAAREERAKTSAERETFRMAEQLAHDIRAPVMALKSLSSTFEESDSRLQLLGKVAERISNIADSLLNDRKISRVTTDVAEVSSGHVIGSIQSIINETVARAHDAVQIKFTCGVVDEATVICEKFALERIISNLLSNSIEAPKTTSVEVTVRSKESALEIRIRDNGIGVKPENFAKLFIRGFSAEKLGGNGLGLWSARHDVESWGGTLTLESVYGTGTIVTINLIIHRVEGHLN